MKRFNILLISFLLVSLSAIGQENSITINTKEGKDTISRYIYGHFAEHLGRCVYDGIWVGKNSTIPNTNGIRNDVVSALKEIEVPVLRWPGGCFAEIYEWKDGVGPQEKRSPVVNMFWGGQSEDNSFGTHEFLDFCSMLGTEPYLAINLGSGTVKNAKDWIEYVNSNEESDMTNWRKQNGRQEPWNVKFWGIGNESWGCGGNMDADNYADLFKQYATYSWVDTRIASGGLNFDMNWTETLMKDTKNYQQLIQGYSFHHYTVSNTWVKKGSAINFEEREWFSTLNGNYAAEKDLSGHIAVMDQYDPEKKIGLYADEWGNWHDPEPGNTMGALYQQNTLRDALTASIYLNIFNNHCDRVKMANIAQLVNVLQAMILTKENKMVKTPTFYVFKMYTVHRDALMLPLSLKCTNYTFEDKSIPAISASASMNKKEEINITISNLDPLKSNSTMISLDTQVKMQVVSAKVITAGQMNSLNDFDKQEEVNLQDFKGYKISGSAVNVDLPAKSIVLLTLKSK
jgi:alpha-N-arabinofuranosidase